MIKRVEKKKMKAMRKLSKREFRAGKNASLIDLMHSAKHARQWCLYAPIRKLY